MTCFMIFFTFVTQKIVCADLDEGMTCTCAVQLFPPCGTSECSI